MREFLLTPIADIIIVKMVCVPSFLLDVDKLKEAKVELSGPYVCQRVNLREFLISLQ